jgi:hypothetical protein
MRIYITCVIKQVELEFLKSHKFCVLLPPDVTANQEEKQVIEDANGQVNFLAVLYLYSLECRVLANQDETLESFLFDVIWN